MIDDLKIAYLQCSEVVEEVEDTYPKAFQVQNPKDLVRLLIEKEIDLIIVSEKTSSLDKLKKVATTYSVPILFLGKTKFIGSQQFIFIEKEESQSLLKCIQSFETSILNMRIKRKNQILQNVLQGTTEFTNKVIHTTKDMFISEVKNFCKKQFRVESCHWVEVKSASSKLPPILKLRQELEKQKVDQRDLISALDDCSSEIAYSDEFQIWKTLSGEYLTLIWVQQEEGLSQCIVLNKVQFKSRDLFQELIGALGPFLKRRWDLCLTVADAKAQVYKDSLTDLYNQKFLNEVLDRKMEEYKRYKTPFSILFIDVDHFKRVNDSLGHIIGSGVLKEMGVLLEEQIRNSDYAFRYGGDEFIILLSHTEGQDAVNVAERIRKKVENFEFNVNGIQVRITVSIGLGFFPVHANSAEEIIRIADEAMYYGKNKSRNIVYKAS